MSYQSIPQTTMAGPLLGGFLADAGLWRGIFLINIPLGLAALLVLFFKVPESRDQAASPSIDYLSAASASLGVVMFVCAGLAWLSAAMAAIFMRGKHML